MYSSIAHSCTNNTVVAGYHDSRRNTDTPNRSLWRYTSSSCARAGVFLGIPVYRFALFTGSFWSCHYRPVNRDIDCTGTTLRTTGPVRLCVMTIHTYKAKQYCAPWGLRNIFHGRRKGLTQPQWESYSHRLQLAPSRPPPCFG